MFVIKAGKKTFRPKLLLDYEKKIFNIPDSVSVLHLYLGLSQIAKTIFQSDFINFRYILIRYKLYCNA